MRTKEFFEYLIREGRTVKASRYRVAACRKVEMEFDVDLDDVVQFEGSVQELRRKVFDHKDFSTRQRKNYPNATKKYYEFVIGNTLPRL